MWTAAAALAMTAMTAACGSTSSTSSSGQKGSGATIDIGLLVPLTGAYADTGQEQKLGAQTAVDEINAAGGVKSLGGAKLKLVVSDAGTAVSDSVTAMTSLLSSNNIVAGIGTGITSNTLAATAVSEQKHVPWLDVTFGDQLTQRGFKYLFITSPLQSSLDAGYYPAVDQLAKGAGAPLSRIGLLPGTNSVLVDTANNIAKNFAPKFGWNVVLNETLAPGSVTGAVASGLVGKIQSTHAQALFVGSATPDVVAIQKQELAQGMTPLPFILSGAPYLSKSFLDALGPQGTQGVMTSASAGVYPSDQAVANKFTAAGQVPNEYNLVPYSEVYMIESALNAAKSTNSAQVRNALASLDIKGGPAGSVWPCNCERFDATGRTSTDGEGVIVQWQGGHPVTVYPPSVAQAKFFFPKGQ
jgi:branched-chain amino acid transport system substrate-binding protein